MTGLWNDARFAMRGLFRAPGFTVITVGTLALGIGATTTIFSVVNGVLLKPLPFEDPDELVGVGMTISTSSLSTAQYFTYRDENQVFEDIGFWDDRQVSVTGVAEPEQLSAILVTAGLLPLLRVQPVIGRRFTKEDDSPGAPETVMLSHAYWQRQFRADPGVVGSTLRVDGRPREILGVLPPQFTLPRQETAIYLPYQLDQAEAYFGGFDHHAIARLLPGATIEQADADVERMMPMSVEQFYFPGRMTLGMLEDRGWVADLGPLKQDFVGDVGNVLWVLLGTVGFVLLIACANVANLFLVRSEGRRQEVAVRTAMGAARGQIARQFLLESLVLGLMGGLAGLGLAYGGVRFLTWMGPESLPRLNEISLDPTVLWFTLGISLLSGILFGLFPVFRVGGLALVASLKEGGRGGSVGKERHRARNTLVVAQMALALVLLAGSGLMIHSFQALRNVDPGFANPEEVLTFRVAIPAAEIEDAAEVALAYEDMWRRLQEIPGVTSVGGSTSLTMDRHGSVGPNLLWIEDFPVPADRLPPARRTKWITGAYFEAMQNPVLAGRPSEWSDIHDRALVAVVTANLAEEYWGSPSAALGKRISLNSPAGGDTWREIVGVVGDVHDIGLSQPAPPLVFMPMAQGWSRTLAFAVRTSRPTASSLLPEVRAVVGAVNWMVLRQGVILTSIGVVVGLVAAVPLTRLMSSLLYGVEATDPVTFGVVVAVLVAVALVASYLPALRASRTDPLEALRFE